MAGGVGADAAALALLSRCGERAGRARVDEALRLDRPAVDLVDVVAGDRPVSLLDERDEEVVRVVARGEDADVLELGEV